MKTQKSTTETLKLISSWVGIIGGMTGMISYKGDYAIVGISLLLIIVSFALTSSVYKLIRSKSIIGSINLPIYAIRSARINDLIEISNLQETCYPDDAVPYEIYKEWFEANPDGFFVIELTSIDSTGAESKEIVGHFTYLAIKSSCMEIYRQGNMLETGITKAHLYNANEKLQMNSIYVESVIIKKQHRKEGVFRLLRMLDSMTAHFCGVIQESNSGKFQKHFYNVEKVYAMAATQDGIKTLRGMGFSAIILSHNKERLDKHEMFECDFDKFISLIRLREEMYEINLLNKAVVPAQ